MKAKYKNKWLIDLRSGEFKQGSKCLFSNGKFCCLGVLANVINPKIWEDQTFGQQPFLPNQMRESCGLACYHETNLADMNDCQLKSFDEIADWIEQNVEVTCEI